MNRGISINPFSTRFVKPGAIPWLGESAATLKSLAEDSLSGDRVSQIVGCHGSGKSTLVHALLEPISRALKETSTGAIEAAQVEWLILNRREDRRRLSRSLANALQRTKNDDGLTSVATIFVVDGIESTRWYYRWWLLRRLKRSRGVTLLTTHRPLPGVNVLTTVTPNRDRFEKVVRFLLQTIEPANSIAIEETFTKARLDQVYELHDGNLRECLMTLYDDWESIV